jgi:hypothetical protein
MLRPKIEKTIPTFFGKVFGGLQKYFPCLTHEQKILASPDIYVMVKPKSAYAG